jgi:hypothetical protein
MIHYPRTTLAEELVAALNAGLGEAADKRYSLYVTNSSMIRTTIC